MVVWQLGARQPYDLSFEGPLVQFLGGLFVGAGVVLMVLALIEMRRHRTTFVPHKEADSLVTKGVFNLSRNPIYLADALILAGLALRWDAPLGLILVPVFIWTIERRFIVPEEKMLRRKFRMDYARYEQATRRWI